ncbi:TIR domain-containing protein [Flavobacterium sp. 90]|uniref:toll/interleukin-1 receptor domain-containing protein n=1 Tax=unclassified Flavobacterium TaxID=196869 RepID=UPI000EAFC234|nr:MULTISPECIES: toll/interleukin-1 receptor domain-containing protein [unclassified Flavobacterium]RKR05646.1 TIR domain-containing protein [Flavobacterium sp. 81]TCK56959.1 TIR domain-containing protein [Flavobacterium sp. 90]
MKVFISHSSVDKKFVRTLKDCLVENSIEIWLDEDQLDLGDSLVTKLENALNTSSHLVIILSPTSVKSDWVKFELNKAISNQRTGLMQKIIPVKYRECEIPEELKDLLYADLSEEVVLPASDPNRIKFISDGFESFFLKLVKAIRSSSKAINSNEKAEIIKTIKSSEEITESHSHSIHRGNYELVGFNTVESKLKYQNLIYKKDNSEENVENLRPFLLPESLKRVFKLELGEKIRIESDMPYSSYGHFAGYRTDDLKITIDKRIRDELYINSKEYYQVEVDLEKKIIRFVNNLNRKPRRTPIGGENNYALAA